MHWLIPFFLITSLFHLTAAAGSSHCDLHPIPDQESELDKELREAEKERQKADSSAQHEAHSSAKEREGLLGGFLKSFTLFRDTWLAGWSIALVLAILGVLTVARDQIFIGAAVTQTSMLGIAFAMWLGALIGEAAPPWISSDAFFSVTAVVFSVLATLMTSRPPAQPGRESPEAITGWLFLVSASGSILLVAHSPHGTEEIHRLVASSIIGATSTDVWVFVGLLIATATALMAGYRPILLMTTDPATADAIGVPTRFWSFIVSGWLGLAIGLSIRVSGMVFTFGCLVLPALVAKNLCREIRTMFWVSPFVALGVCTVAFAVANHMDLPPAQVTVVSLGGALILAWGFRTLRRLAQRG